MSIRAVVWDVDDTLFDYTTADREGMRSHLVAEGLIAGYDSPEQALERWREVTDRQWARFSAGEVTFQGQRRDRVRVFLGAELTDAEADDWFQRYIGHYETAWALFPDVLPVLDALAASHRHAVLSNSSIEVQDHKLRVLGVHHRFESILCAAELGVSKPEAAAFLAACEALALPPHEVHRGAVEEPIRRTQDPLTPLHQPRDGLGQRLRTVRTEAVRVHDRRTSRHGRLLHLGWCGRQGPRGRAARHRPGEK